MVGPLSVKTMSRLLASIFRSHWTVKSHSILKFSLSTIPSIRLICSYQLLALSNPHLLQSWQSVPCHDIISIMPFIIIIFFLRCRYNRLFPHRLFLWFRGVGQSTFSILFFIWVFTCLLFTMSSDSIHKIESARRVYQFTQRFLHINPKVRSNSIF